MSDSNQVLILCFGGSDLSRSIVTVEEQTTFQPRSSRVVNQHFLSTKHYWKGLNTGSLRGDDCLLRPRDSRKVSHAPKRLMALNLEISKVNLFQICMQAIQVSCGVGRKIMNHSSCTVEEKKVSAPILSPEARSSSC